MTEFAPPARVLILGGTTEASSLAARLANDARFTPLLSFAGATKSPRPPPIPHRIGGFGGSEGLAAFLRTGGTTLLVDATHPFAARMKRNAAEAAQLAPVKLLAIHRPEWQPVPGDRWTIVPHMAAAAAALGEAPRRVLLTIGQKDLAEFRAAPHHHYVVRSVDPPTPDALPPKAEIISARGPFDEAAETHLLQSRGIEILVTKNAGGTATVAKLAATRALGLPVVMVARPQIPEGVARVPDSESAWRWLEAHAGTARGV